MQFAELNECNPKKVDSFIYLGQVLMQEISDKYIQKQLCKLNAVSNQLHYQSMYFAVPKR